MANTSFGRRLLAVNGMLLRRKSLWIALGSIAIIGMLFIAAMSRMKELIVPVGPREMFAGPILGSIEILEAPTAERFTAWLAGTTEWQPPSKLDLGMAYLNQRRVLAEQAFVGPEQVTEVLLADLSDKANAWLCQVIDKLAACDDLTTLHLGIRAADPGMSFRMTERLGRSLAQVRSLTTLRIQDSLLEQNCLWPLLSSPQLQTLELRGCKTSTEQPVSIPPLPRVNTLDLADCLWVNDAEMVVLNELPALKHLRLHTTLYPHAAPLSVPLAAGVCGQSGIEALGQLSRRCNIYLPDSVMTISPDGKTYGAPAAIDLLRARFPAGWFYPTVIDMRQWLFIAVSFFVCAVWCLTVSQHAGEVLSVAAAATTPRYAFAVCTVTALWCLPVLLIAGTLGGQRGGHPLPLAVLMLLSVAFGINRLPLSRRLASLHSTLDMVIVTVFVVTLALPLLFSEARPLVHLEQFLQGDYLVLACLLLAAELVLVRKTLQQLSRLHATLKADGRESLPFHHRHAIAAEARTGDVSKPVIDRRFEHLSHGHSLSRWQQFRRWKCVYSQMGRIPPAQWGLATALWLAALVTRLTGAFPEFSHVALEITKGVVGYSLLYFLGRTYLRVRDRMALATTEFTLPLSRGAIRKLTLAYVIPSVVVPVVVVVGLIWSLGVTPISPKDQAIAGVLCADLVLVGIPVIMLLVTIRPDWLVVPVMSVVLATGLVGPLLAIEVPNRGQAGPELIGVLSALAMIGLTLGTVTYFAVRQWAALERTPGGREWRS